MPTTANHPTEESGGTTRSGRGTNYPPGNRHPSPPPEVPHNNDFDDGANALWSLYGKEAKNRDKARIQTLKDDMDGVLIFAGLFSAVLTAFVVPKIQDLEEDPAQKSAYYQQQSALALVHISQQIAAIGTQTSIGSTPPFPDYVFHPSASDRRVNICWLLSLVFSLSAALLATLVQQWVRAYMRLFQLSSNPLKTARIRLFLFEGVEPLPMLAEAVPGLIHASLILFFLGFSTPSEKSIMPSVLSLLFPSLFADSSTSTAPSHR
ncbi:hypothetical protein BC826DRAFT_115406 [Russula brevipes]|nr:hypothetical protein BC826DRAFT_115406 [Russula brevipes]